MKIELFYIGKKSKNLFSDAESEYIKRINRYCSYQHNTLAPVKNAKALPSHELKKAEASLFSSKLTSPSYTIVLDENGKQMNSIDFAAFIEKIRMTNTKVNIFVGGAYGFDQEFLNQADYSLSLSKMTMAHHLARTVFAEQLYRAFSIINNEPYHNS